MKIERQVRIVVRKEKKLNVKEKEVMITVFSFILLNRKKQSIEI